MVIYDDPVDFELSRRRQAETAPVEPMESVTDACGFFGVTRETFHYDHYARVCEAREMLDREGMLYVEVEP